MADLAELTTRVRVVRAACDREAGAARALGEAGVRAEQSVVSLRAEIERHERVARLLTTIGEERQETAQRQIEGLVTRGLQVIFGENLSFHLVQSLRSNQAQADFVIRSVYDDYRDGEPSDQPVVVETPVLEARGGGMAVVVAFILRLVVLLLTPGARRVLFLDESFAQVSREYEPRVAEFLREVCDGAGVQIVMITHSDAYSDVADRVYRTELAPNGITALAGLREEDLV